MAKTTPTRWAPHWETIEGVVYMTETGDTIHNGRKQVGYRETRDEDGILLTGDISQKRTGMDSAEITGSGGSDLIRLEKDAKSTVNAGAGHDTVRGSQVNDLIHGGDGNDYVRGGRGNDIVYGDAGNDRVTGGKGNDTLHGGDGHDFLFGGAGTDIMFGGSGDDIFYLKDALDPSIGDFRTIVDTADIIKDFEQGQDKIRVGTKEHVIYQNVTVGGTDTYTLIFGLKDEGGTHVRGIIEGDVDLTRSDFKNARSVAEIDAVSVDAWPDDSHELPELLSPVGDAGII
jgi:hypothetical protein